MNTKLIVDALVVLFDRGAASFFSDREYAALAHLYASAKRGEGQEALARLQALGDPVSAVIARVLACGPDAVAMFGSNEHDAVTAAQYVVERLAGACDASLSVAEDLAADAFARDAVLHLELAHGSTANWASA